MGEEVLDVRGDGEDGKGGGGLFYSRTLNIGEWSGMRMKLLALPLG